MQLSLVLAALLCLTTWLNCVQATTGPVQNCPCVSWSKSRVHPDRIVSYINQTEAVCSISAVKFLTIRGITFCADPNSNWAKQVIKKVNAKTRVASTASTNTPPQKKQDWIVTTKGEKIQDDEGSASDMTPAASTASTNTTPQIKTGLNRDYSRKCCF
ncbi:C-C motif chemokine 3-like [Melanotaenia boesemani]|uniref:C-C motif chemokine 3-like n=1 Tax=Melanotaenia boesemani TaxID=1250792 RepID=UPI001C03CC34|nr:C-C motif chemokine 3-like [Melanotaenia boesemani]